MEKYLLAVDIGTTSAKCLAVSSTGEVMSVQQKFYPTSFPQPGFAEQDPESIYQGVLEIVKASVHASSACAGICFSAAMHSLTAVDENGNALMPLIIWSDLRSAKQFREVEQQGLAATLCNLTGTPVHPMSPLCKLMWLKEGRPEIFSKAFKFISIKEYIFFRLTGEWTIDHSIASATGLFDLEKLAWSEQALRLVSLSKEKLSEPVEVTEKFYLREEMAAQWGIDRHTPLIIGASDGCLAQLGSGAMNPGDLSITLGTSGAVRLVSSERLIDPSGKIFNYILQKGQYVCGGATNNGTALLNWYTKKIDPSSETKMTALVEKALTIPPGCEGLIMLPYLLGERAPVYNPDSRGVFFGMAVHHTSLHLQRAMLEAICFELMWIVEFIEKASAASSRILVSGGFTHSPPWVQLLSDVMGRELILTEKQDASSYGAAILGWQVLGHALHAEQTEVQVFRPNQQIHSTYAKLFPVFKKLYTHTISLLEDLNKIHPA
jgi:gluconokinase